MEDQQPVEKLNEHDVLFGRGSGTRFHKGNKRFRSLIDDHKPEYSTYSKHAEKTKLATRLFRHVHSLGGRFLRLDESAGKCENIVKNGVWYEVKEKEALDKIRQALRNRNSDKKELSTSVDETGGGRSSTKKKEVASSCHPTSLFSDNGPTVGMSSDATALALSALPSTMMTPLLSQTAMNPVISSDDPRLLLFQSSFRSMLQQQQPPSSAPPTVPGTKMSPSALQLQVMDTAFSRRQQQQQQQQIPNPLMLHAAMYPGISIDVQSPSFPPMLQQQYKFSSVASNIPSNTRSPAALRPKAVSGAFSQQEGLPQPSAVPPFQRPAMWSPIHKEEEQQSNDSLNDLLAAREISVDDNNQKPSDEDMSEFLMSVLQLSGLPRFSDHAEVKAELSDEEKAAALADVFGKYCNVDTHKNKRARRDLDPESIAFLLKHMRNEIAKVPNDEKQALMEAQEKCEAEEFSDARLERFLRCVGMDVPLATQRFVKYWKMRREVFGPEKFTLPMTLSGALCDDLVALETGWFSLLPKCDLSGRQLLYMVPSRHKREGYTSESLLRAGWYVIEMASRSDANVVNLIWDKDSTLFDFDRHVYEKFAFLKAECWPVKFECSHLCCTRNLAARVLLPVVLAFQSKQWHARFVVHDVPQEDIISALSAYGITKEMLPSDTFRGSVQFHQSEWIAQRRTAELGEI